MKKNNNKLIKIDLENFARKFIVASYRERFLVEIQKKPEKMMKRVSHDIENVFCSTFLNPIKVMNLNVNGYLFDVVGNVERIYWKDAMKKIHQVGGGGWLFISICGNFFYSETEGEPPKCKFGNFR